MKKLALRLDDLTVDSFATRDADPARGTVGANAYTQVTCNGNESECWTWYAPTCQQTCGLLDTCHGENTCQWSCNGTCYQETACIHCVE